MAQWIRHPPTKREIAGSSPVEDFFSLHPTPQTHTFLCATTTHSAVHLTTIPTRDLYSTDHPTRRAKEGGRRYPQPPAHHPPLPPPNLLFAPILKSLCCALRLFLSNPVLCSSLRACSLIETTRLVPTKSTNHASCIRCSNT